MAINKTWLLYRGQFGRRLKNVAVSSAQSLLSSGFVKRAANWYIEKTQIAPSCLVVPSISGTVAVGQTLTTSDGTWAGKPTPTLTYQWLRGGANIAGATAKTYVIVAGDVGQALSCKVTGTNENGVYFVVGSPTAPVPAEGEDPIVMDNPDALAKPANVVLPSISGVAQVGEVLECTPGTWEANPAPIFAYQWKLDAVALEGATEPAYLVDVGDIDGVITCTVVASNSEGTSQRTTAPTSAVIAA